MAPLAREQSQLSLLMIDVDYFKSYNDTFGHVAGDEALRQVAGAIREGCSRSSDLAARYGGEEFAMVLPGTSPGGAVLAEKVRRTVESLQISHDQPRPGSYLTVSIGVSTLVPGGGGQTFRVLIEMADQALYQAKNNGRNQVGLMEQPVPPAPAERRAAAMRRRPALNRGRRTARRAQVQYTSQLFDVFPRVSASHGNQPDPQQHQGPLRAHPDHSGYL